VVFLAVLALLLVVCAMRVQVFVMFQPVYHQEVQENVTEMAGDLTVVLVTLQVVLTA
jgi:hypothetical protein